MKNDAAVQRNGTVFSMFIAVSLLLMCFPCYGKKHPVAGTYFVDVNSDAVIVIKLTNQREISTDVQIQRFSTDGSLMNSINKAVAGNTTTDVRLEVPNETYLIRKVTDVIVDGQHRTVIDSPRTWIRVVGDIVVSATSEYLKNDTLNELALNSHIANSGHVKIDDTSSPGEYAFVNLSDRPVHVGLCREAEWTGSCNPTPSDLVAPRAMMIYPIEKGYIRLGSKETCSYVTSKVFYSTGLQRTFGSTTSISFEPVK
jgi:hypothetical protein